jgi:hypothetical protein
LWKDWLQITDAILFSLVVLRTLKNKSIIKHFQNFPQTYITQYMYLPLNLFSLIYFLNIFIILIFVTSLTVLNKKKWETHWSLMQIILLLSSSHMYLPTIRTCRHEIKTSFSRYETLNTKIVQMQNIMMAPYFFILICI